MFKQDNFLTVSFLERVFGVLSLVSFFMLTVLSFLFYQIPFVLWLGFFISLIACFFIYIARKRLFLYVIGRIFEAFITLFIVASITFVLLRLLPGGPFDQEKTLPPEIQANISAKYHLDKPLYWQYTHYLKGLFRGYLGESYKYTDRNISDILKDSLPVSIQLGIYALILAFLLGIPLGVFAAQKQDSWMDRTAMVFSISGVSLPSFVIAPIFILIFAFYLKWLEPALWEGTLFYILPAVVLGLRPASVIARLTRSSVLDVISSDFVRTARAKGLDERKVFYKHIFKKRFSACPYFFRSFDCGDFNRFFYYRKNFCYSGFRTAFCE